MASIQFNNTILFSNLDMLLSESLSLESSRGRSSAFDEQLQLAKRRGATYNEPKLTEVPERRGEKYDNRSGEPPTSKIVETRDRHADDERRQVDPASEDNRPIDATDDKSQHDVTKNDANDESRDPAEASNAQTEADAAAEADDDERTDDANDESRDPAEASNAQTEADAAAEANDDETTDDASEAVLSPNDPKEGVLAAGTDDDPGVWIGAAPDETGNVENIIPTDMENGTSGQSSNEANLENVTAETLMDQSTAGTAETPIDQAANDKQASAQLATLAATAETNADAAEETTAETQQGGVQSSGENSSTRKSETAGDGVETSTDPSRKGVSLIDRMEDRIEDAAQQQGTGAASDGESGAASGANSQNIGPNLSGPSTQSTGESNVAVTSVDSSGLQQQSSQGGEQQGSGDRLASPQADAIQNTSRSQASSTTGSSGNGTTSADQARFIQRVERAFQTMLRRGDDTIRLRLSPPELGSLRLQISVKNGEMTARIQTESDMARMLLLDNLPALRERLAEQDIKIVRFEVERVDYDDQSSHYTADQETGQEDNENQNRSSDTNQAPSLSTVGQEPDGTTEDPNTFNPGVLDIMV